MFFTKSTSEMFEDLNRISREMNKVFDAPLWKTTTFNAEFDDVERKDDGLELALPGFTKEDINIEVDGRIMTISAEIEKESKYRKSFVRYFSINEDIDPKKIEATMENGVLHIKWHKKESTKKVTKVEIK